jgi:hypothetical protein
VRSRMSNDCYQHPLPMPPAPRMTAAQCDTSCQDGRPVTSVSVDIGIGEASAPDRPTSLGTPAGFSVGVARQGASIRLALRLERKVRASPEPDQGSHAVEARLASIASTKRTHDPCGARGSEA